MLISAGMMIGLSARAAVDVKVLHDRNPLFVTLSDGSIRNGYTVKILNKSREPRAYNLSIAGLEGAPLTVAGQDGDAATEVELAAKPDGVTTYRVSQRTAGRARGRGRGADHGPDRPRGRRVCPSRDGLPGSGLMTRAPSVTTDRSRWIPYAFIAFFGVVLLANARFRTRWR